MGRNVFDDVVDAFKKGDTEFVAYAPVGPETIGMLSEEEFARVAQKRGAPCTVTYKMVDLAEVPVAKRIPGKDKHMKVTVTFIRDQ